MHYEFENSMSLLYFKTLGAALEYAHENNTRIVRVLS